MKKNILYLLILLFLLLPSQYIMLTGYKSLDGKIHSARIDQFHQAVILKQIPVRLAPTLIDNIGYPLFIVNYQLPYYLAELFMQINNDSEFAYKAVMSSSFILSGVFAYLLFREFSSYWAAIAGAVVFSYLPYRFGDLYMRGAFGESVSIMFIPLILLSAHKVLRKKSYGIVFLALSIFGLITSHTVVFLMFTPIFIIYFSLIAKFEKKKMIRLLFATAIGILLSSFQLLPSIFEKKYMIFDQSLAGYYNSFFISLNELLRIPGSGVNIGTYLQVGIVGTIIFIISAFRFYQIRNKYILLFLVSGILSIFLNHSSSEIIWKYLPGMKYVIYPYRFFIITIFSASFLSVILLDKIKFKSLFAILIIIVTLYTNRHYYINVPPWFEIQPSRTLTTLEENNSIWTNENTFDKRDLISTNNNSSVTILKKDPFRIIANIKTYESTKITIRKMFFPGWKVKSNDEYVGISKDDGLIIINVEQGDWNIETYFSESPIRKFSNLLSLFTLIFIVYIYNQKIFLKRLINY